MCCKLAQMLHEETDGKAVITTGVGQHQMWAAQWYDYDLPRHWATSGEPQLAGHSKCTKCVESHACFCISPGSIEQLSCKIETYHARIGEFALQTCADPRSIHSGGLGSMGFGLPSALGAAAALAEPARHTKPVVDIDGDGSFLMNVQVRGAPALLIGLLCHPCMG